MLLLRERRPSESNATRTRPKDADDAAATGPRIRCRGCGTALSEPHQIFSPTGGVARSVFANPAGRVFEVLSVRHAAAVVLWGEPTLEHTWFSGYAWRPITCSVCGRHLGWCFDAVADAEPARFYSFITSEVVEDER